MAKEWEPGSCNEKSGFLFNHECFQPPADNCSVCQKPICADHTHLSDTDGRVCTSCAKKKRQPPGRGKSVGKSSRASDRYDDRYDEPYFYGGYYFATMHHHDRNDPNDFTEADAASLSAESDEGFENDMSES